VLIVGMVRKEQGKSLFGYYLAYLWRSCFVGIDSTTVYIILTGITGYANWLNSCINS
jgi:hypothetical protein